MSGVTVNLSGLADLQKQLKDLEKKELQVGWFESAKYGDNTPVAGIMAQNEYGNPKLSIPPRPFMRSAASDNQGKWDETAKKEFAAVVQGKTTPDNVLKVLGLQAVGDIKNSITMGNWDKLSPVTIALRKLRKDGKKIGGALVGSVASAIANGKTGSGELGDQSFGNKDPLRETRYAISTLTFEVVK